MIVSSRKTLRAPDNRIHTSIYSPDSAISCILLLVFSHGIVEKERYSLVLVRVIE